MRHAQIERLRTLKKLIVSNVTIDAGAVLADLEELVDILLMERDDHDGEGED